MADASSKVTTVALRARKAGAEKIAVVTAYDVVFARLADDAGVDAVLVGDSLGMVVQGESTTLPVTLDEMVYHTRLVTRAVRRAHVVALDDEFDLAISIEADGQMAASGCSIESVRINSRNLSTVDRAGVDKYLKKLVRDEVGPSRLGESHCEAM
jgi:ketopantoate hydroxymethyltransferase